MKFVIEESLYVEEGKRRGYQPSHSISRRALSIWLHSPPA
jgi:hypothetical protein